MESSQEISSGKLPTSEAHQEQRVSAEEEIDHTGGGAGYVGGDGSMMKQLEDMIAQQRSYQANAALLQAQMEMMRRVLEPVSEHGTLVWRIDKFMDKLTEAKRPDGVKFYFSSPFYSHFYGYKMVVKLYPNGDGAGNGSYLSLYIILQKTEYDGILGWPFKQSMKFMILNQAGKSDHVLQVNPDPKSPAFQKPQGEQNVGSGSPKFLQHQLLSETNTRRYVGKDGALFVKVVIDQAGLI